MGLDFFNNKKVFFDTSIFIYYLEENKNYINILNAIFAKVLNYQIVAVSSVLTLTECLIKPFKEFDNQLIEAYKDIFLNNDNLKIVTIDYTISVEAARIRALYSFRTPDSIQLSSAICEKCQLFLTNDKRLKSFKELQIIILNELKL